MKLTVLMDNNTIIDDYYLGEPAVCYFIEDGGKRILFDMGYSGAFLKNAEAMGIDLQQLDAAVFSHGHNDHTGGLPDYLEFRKSRRPLEVVAHPDCFDKKRIGGTPICSPLTHLQAALRCSLLLTREPAALTPRLTFLGEIPEYTAFEGRHQIGEREQAGAFVPDFLPDDSALCYRSEQGLCIITGCSHAGICNIIEHARRVCRDERIYAVLGGLHLFEVDERLHRTAAFLKQAGIQRFYPCHCTSFAAKAELHREIPGTEVGVGFSVEWI